MYKSLDVDNLIDKLKIEDVVGEYVDLKKSGSNYKGLCPFHQDTNPSFMVSPNKNICKCFVCGAGGNPVTFYSKYKKIPFNEAIKELSKKYNIDIVEYGNLKNNEDNEKYFKLMEAAMEFYKKKIFENDGRLALEYLSNREISPKIIQENHLGYAPTKWDELYSYLSEQNYETEDIEAMGLIKKSNDNSYRDTFRNRIMFPIFSSQGRIIAFGGRSLENSKEIPKYINSSDTPIFKKGKNLYGIERGHLIRKKNYAFLMEGYMDVLSTSIYGIDVALAPLGTALTEEQAVLLKRYTDNIILAFDSDAAGLLATERAIFILKSYSFNIRVLELKGAKDPDEFLKKYGKQEFLNAVKSSLEAFEFLYELYIKDYDLKDVISKQKFVERFKELFENIESELEKSVYIDKLSSLINIDREILKKVLIDNNKKVNKKIYRYRSYKDSIENKEQYNERYLLELDTIKIILDDFKLHKFYSKIPFENNITFEIFNFLGEKIKDNPEISGKIIWKEVKNHLEDLEKFSSEKEEIIKFIIDLISLEKNEEFKEEKIKENIKSWINIQVKDSDLMKKFGFTKELIEIKKMQIKLMKLTNLEDLYITYESFIKKIDEITGGVEE